MIDTHSHLNFPELLSQIEEVVLQSKKAGLTGIIIARPEILIVKIENERIKRVPAEQPFRWDGFANPSRAEG